MPSKDEEPSALEYLLNEMDVQSEDVARGSECDESWSCNRDLPRHAFRTVCMVRFMSASTGTFFALKGRTRNLSRRGLSLLVRRVFTLGEPVEIELRPRGRPATFVTGLIRFCRYAGRGYHEVGVELKSASPSPILSGNHHLAMRELDRLVGGAKAR